MNWIDIEAEWAAMTRRVQSDQLRVDDDTVITRRPTQPTLQRDEPTKMRAQPPLDRSAN